MHGRIYDVFSPGSYDTLPFELLRRLKEGYNHLVRILQRWTMFRCNSACAIHHVVPVRHYTETPPPRCD